MTSRKTVAVDAVRRIFVDDSILDRTRGVKRTFHQAAKHPDNPIMFNNRPWESKACRMHGTVLRDAGTGEFRMWYYGAGGSDEEVRYRSVVAYATSVDGLRWRKPDLHIHDFHGQTANNICRQPHHDSTGEFWYVDGIAVLHEPDDPDPMRRYKMMTTQKKTGDEFNTKTPYPSGYYVAFSPDGLHWEERPQPYFTMIKGFGDTMGLMRDPRNNRYVAHVKIASADYRKYDRYNWIQNEGYFAWDDGKWIKCPSSRYRGISVSEDFVSWSEPEYILPTDEHDGPGDQVYDTSIFPYESVYLGLADIYHPVTGTTDCQLIWSPDGLDWRRSPDRTPTIPVGRDLSDWDCGGHCASNNPPIRMGDELWFYYGSAWWRHPGGSIKVFRPGVYGYAIGLAKLRVDGFMSLDGGARRGRVTTVPVECVNDGLCVNADAEGGELRAQLLRGGRQIPGFEFKSCAPIRHDAVRHVVRFKGGAIPRSKTPIRVEFALKDASLYSFWTEPLPPKGVFEA